VLLGELGGCIVEIKWREVGTLNKKLSLGAEYEAQLKPRVMTRQKMKSRTNNNLSVKKNV
jgi:hypothetical protein